MGFIIAYKEAFVALVVVFLGLLWFGWVLSGPSKEEKQEERRRKIRQDAHDAKITERNNRLMLERGKATGRSPRDIKPKAPQAGRPMTLNTEAGTTSVPTPRISPKLGRESSR